MCCGGSHFCLLHKQCVCTDTGVIVEGTRLDSKDMHWKQGQHLANGVILIPTHESEKWWL